MRAQCFQLSISNQQGKPMLKIPDRRDMLTFSATFVV